MKRSAIILLLALLVGASGIGFEKWQSSQFKPFVVDACKIMTEKVALTVLQPPLVRMVGKIPNDHPEDIYATECGYRPAILDSSGNQYSIVLTVRIAKTIKGKESNLDQFRTYPKATDKIDGLGDKAFWVKGLNVLFVLKHNNWYQLTYTTGSIDTGVRTPSGPAVHVARLIINQL